MYVYVMAGISTAILDHEVTMRSNCCAQMKHRTFRSGVPEITQELPTINSSGLPLARFLLCEKEIKSNILIILAVGLWQVT